MATPDELDLSRTDFNAGTARTLEEARTAAHARATATGKDVGLYEHVGGVGVKGHRVAATGQFLWRDLVDEDGRAFGAPKRYYQDIEVVHPGAARRRSARTKGKS